MPRALAGAACDPPGGTRRRCAEGRDNTMHVTVRHILITALIAGSAMAANGCVHLKGSATPPTPSGLPTSPPSGVTPPPSGNCQAQNGAAQIVEISPDITATTDPTYGPIGESALAPANGFPNVAAVIHLTSGTSVQFANVDGANVDSAVGLGTTGFPPTPHTFPGGAQNPIGTAVGGTTWSTGRLAIPTGGTPCFSQTFTVPSVSPGTTLAIYFGDLDRYNTIPSGTAYRNVIVVTSTGAQPRERPRRQSILVHQH